MYNQGRHSFGNSDKALYNDNNNVMYWNDVCGITVSTNDHPLLTRAIYKYLIMHSNCAIYQNCGVHGNTVPLKKVARHSPYQPDLVRRP